MIPDLEAHEHEGQHVAELENSPGAQGASQDPEVGLYRQVFAAIREAPLPQAPLGFAARLEREALARAERRRRAEALESWGVILALALLVGLLLVSVAPWLGFRLGTGSLDAPWRPALAAGAALGLWKLVERLRVASRPAGLKSRP